MGLFSSQSGVEKGVFITCCVFHHEIGYSVCVECYEWVIFSMRGVHFSIKRGHSTASGGAFHRKAVLFLCMRCPFSSQSGVEKGVSPYFLGKIAQNNPLFCVFYAKHSENSSKIIKKLLKIIHNFVYFMLK